MNLTNTNKVLDDFGKTLTSRIKKNLNVKNDTGKLEASIVIGHVNGTNSIAVNISMEEYGKWVDEGRRPGKGMPVDLLQKWIQRRGLVYKDAKGNVLPMTPNRLDALSYVINKKIKEEGIEPTDFIQAPLDALFPELAVDIEEAYLNDVLVYLIE